MGITRKIVKDLNPFLSVILGATIALIGTYATNYSAAQKDYQAERRQKLETLVADLFESEQCEFDTERRSTPIERCSTRAPEDQSIAYAKLYFPEMYRPVMKYQEDLARRDLDFTTCLAHGWREAAKDAVSDTAALEDARIREKCLVAFSAKPRSDLEPIVDQARNLGLTLQPTKATVWPFSS